MTKIYIIYLCFVLSVFITTIAIGQVTAFEDKFDNYTVGQLLACQNPAVWTTWTGNPCNTTEDAEVASNYSYSDANSVVIKQNNDIVKEIGTPLNSGLAEINFQVYIPSGKAGYFNTLASFAPPNYVWAMQVFLNSSGTGTLDAGNANAATFSYPHDQWLSIKVVADLTADAGEFWLNGVKIHSWQWTLGTFGTTIAKQLDGIDFYGYTADDEMYIDDFLIVHTAYTNKVISTPTGGNWNSGSTWVGGKVPNANTRDAEIVAGATVTLTGNTTRNRATIVKGKLNCGNYYLSGSGSFTLSGSGELQIGSASGITLSGASGNIQVTGTRYFNQLASYIYSGNAAQVTGNGLPVILKNLNINNPAGVTLSSNTIVSGSLDLDIGDLNTNGNSLTLGTSSTNPGTLAHNSLTISGSFNRWISPSASLLFPVGTSSTKYTPVVLSNISGTGTFSVSAVAGPHPNVLGTNVLQMYWKLTNGGLTSADVTFNYLDADVVGNESNYVIGKYDGNWSFPGGFINPTTNQATILGVTTFSDWSLGDQSALPVELSSFSASVAGSNVKLRWETATEVNNYGFEVERKVGSLQSTVGNYEKVGFVNGNGNSNSPKNYSFEDKNVSAGKYSYRLKQIDNDGQFEYSKSIEVEFGTPKKFELSQNYPNPFNPTTTIRFDIPEPSNVKLTLFNILGQEIKTLVNEFKESGIHTLNFDASDLNSGMYIYKLEAGSFTQTRKMTLVK